MKNPKSKKGLLVAVIIVCATVLLVSSNASAKKGDNNHSWLKKYSESLISYYNFDGNVNDVSGNGHDATNFNADCFVGGVNNQSCDFKTGAGLQYVLIPDNDDLDFNSGDFSISSWVYLRDNGRWEWDTIVSHYATSKGWIFEIFGDRPFCQNCLSFTSAASSDKPYVEYEQYRATSYDNSVTLNEWNHLVMTMENEKVTFYVNGEFKGETSGIRNPKKYDTGGFYVGGLGYDGRMDDLMFFNKALSQKEVGKIYKKANKGKDEDDNDDHEDEEDDNDNDECEGEYGWLNKFKKTLVSYYPFEGNANDISANAKNGFSNGADYVADGICGQSVSFLDNTDNIAIEYNPQFRLTRDDFTISVWVNPNSLKEYNAILDQGGLSYVYTGPSFYIKGNGEIKFSFEESADVDSSPNQVAAGTLASLNEWQHLAVTREGNTLRIYVNGELEGENASLTPIANYATYFMQVGNYSRLEYEEFPGYTFDGRIDELSFFNKALSKKEIRKIIKHSTK